MTRRVKLVCTLGPGSSGADAVLALAEAGTDVFRVNMSHGSPESLASAVSDVRRAAERLGRDLAVMADLPGPKVRLGELAPDPLRLDRGAAFVLRGEGEAPGDAGAAPTSYPGLADDVRPGDRILLADGAAELIVRGTRGSDVITEVVRGGDVRSRAGVNVPAERLGLPAVTDRDRVAVAAAADLGADLVAQSFVRSPADVVDLRALMGSRPVPIVAKIETRPAVDSIDRIAVEADAVMVARGDLGVELPMEEIPVLQKELLRIARAAGRPTIVATQMLESMVHSPRPTRAEASDVANAVLDGADAMMLSGETAIGAYAVEAAVAASRIAEVAERRAAGFRTPAPACTHTDEAAAVAHAAARVADADRAVVAIACYTVSGRTAALLSSERPDVPVFAFCPEPDVRRALGLRWGVVPLDGREPTDTDAMIAAMDVGLGTRGLVPSGASVVMVASSPAGRTPTNLLKVHRIGDAPR